MSRIGQTDLSKVPVAELEAMRDAGECVRECYRVLRRTNDSIVSEYMKRNGAPHPESNGAAAPIMDRKTNSQYWFHKNTAEEQPHEAGHFHTYVRPRRIPQAGVAAPAARPAQAPAADADLCHIIAIAMDGKGFPARLFAPNRWLAGGAWRKADDVCHHLAYFTIDHAEPSYPVNVWITNMLVLFRPQIREILAARDRLIAVRRQQRPEEDVLEDRALPVMVERPIDVTGQLAAVREALRGQTSPAGHVGRIIEPAPLTAAANAALTEPPVAQLQDRAVERALQAQIQTLHNAVISAKTTAHALDEQLEAARRQAFQREQEKGREIAELRLQHESELARRLAESKTRLHAEFQRKLDAARGEWQSSTAARLAAARNELEDIVSAARAEAIANLRAQWQTESRHSLAAAIEARKAEEARRLNAAKEKWAAAQRECLAERDRTWQTAFEHRVEEALVAWRKDEDARFSQAKSEWHAERKFRDASRRTIGLWGRRIARALLVAAVIGAGAALYPKAEPIAAQVWTDIVVAKWRATTSAISGAIDRAAKAAPLPGRPGATGGPDTDPPVASAPPTYITVPAANLRSRPSPNAGVNGVLLQGMQVVPIRRKGRWLQVRAPGSAGSVGWVHDSLVGKPRK